MTTAVKQFLRDVSSIQVLGTVGIVFVVALVIWVAVTAPPPTAEAVAAQKQRQARSDQAKRLKQQLCIEAKACKRYSEARLECATAGNFKTCLRIKMGEDSFYSDMCSGYDLGAPAVPLETPTAVECFFLTPLN